MIEIKDLLHNKYNTLVTFISLTMLQTKIKTIFICTQMHLKDCLWLNHNTAVHGTAFACLTICLAPYHHWSLSHQHWLSARLPNLTPHIARRLRRCGGAGGVAAPIQASLIIIILVFCDINKLYKKHYTNLIIKLG